MIDTHCHLYDEKLYNDLDTIVENAHSANVKKMICIGDRIKTSQKSMELTEKYQNVFASVGVHPHEAKNVSTNYLNKLEKFTEHKKVVAIGEIGLDYYYNFSDSKTQKLIFLEQLKLAKKLKLPTVVHCRNADDDLYNTIVKSKSKSGVIHCFSSNLNFAKKIIDLGYLISFTGMITFVKDLEKVIKNINLKHILIETDSPYLAPIPYRGKKNQPAYVVEVAKKIAAIKGVDIQRVINMTTQNAYSLFTKLKI